MTTKRNNGDNIYRVGGTLSPDDPIYVSRKADDELYQCLKKREYCYVFNSRQMGKSSLVVRSIERLKTEGNFQSVIIDLSRIGSEVTQEQWYYSLIKGLSESFELDITKNIESWWEVRKKQTYSDQLADFFEELLNNLQDNILIAIDEIDSIISLKFSTNDFFAFIRYCYNKRASDSKYNRLTFCLLGVATPSDLISDLSRTPFNIGKAIELKGFTLDEAKQGLTKGLKVDNPDHVLEKIIEWTYGQPFLTQKLCSLVVEEGDKNPDIDHLVNTKIIKNWEANDHPEHLKTLRDRILWDDEELGIRLKLYREILRAGESGIKASNTLVEEKLRLSGLVIRTDGRLRFSNKICQTIFDLNWVQTEINKLRPYPKEYVTNWKEYKDELWLLTGQDLKKALVWKRQMGVHLSQDNQDFIEASQLADLTKQTKLKEVLVELRERLIDKTKNTLQIANEILDWTNRDIELTTIICQSIETESQIKEGEEKQWVTEWIKENIIGDWQKYKPLQKIGETLLDSSSSLERLTAYQKILQGGVPENENALNALLVSKLINEETLQVANRIYEQVFSLEWVREKLCWQKINTEVSVLQERKNFSEYEKNKINQCLERLKIFKNPFEFVEPMLSITEGQSTLIEYLVDLIFQDDSSLETQRDIEQLREFIFQYENIQKLITKLRDFAEFETIFLTNIDETYLLLINENQDKKHDLKQLDLIQSIVTNNIKNYANKAQEYNQNFEIIKMQLFLKDKVIYAYRLLPNIMLIITGIQRVEIVKVENTIQTFWAKDPDFS